MYDPFVTRPRLFPPISFVPWFLVPSNPFLVTFDVVPVSTGDEAMGGEEGVGGMDYARPIYGLRVTTPANGVSYVTRN